jgi:hypothetical protein
MDYKARMTFKRQQIKANVEHACERCGGTKHGKQMNRTTKGKQHAGTQTNKSDHRTKWR